MREIRPSGLEGGETLIRFPYPYLSKFPPGVAKSYSTGNSEEPVFWICPIPLKAGKFTAMH